jgi:thioesterase domain-containing protein/acyl carrier protein
LRRCRLGVDKVGIRDSFFDLGGHSLIAVRLFAKIKKAYQVDYPISVLFEAPTIERCADLIRLATGASRDESSEPRDVHRTRYVHLVTMHARQGARGRPFFPVAGMFGNVLNLRHLAGLIGADRPFYGLQARGLYGDHTPHETFEEMARDYLKELKSVQPEGPYLLGGFSGGGVTAYEMAQQLIASGEDVALLAMLDTPLPQSPRLSAHEKVLIHLQRVRRKGPSYFTDWAKNRVRWELDRIKKEKRGPEAERAGDFHSATIEAAFRRALVRYAVHPYAGRITLFRPKLDIAHVLGPGRVTNVHREFVFHDNGWGPYAGEVVVHEVPGDHDGMVLEPNVRVLASRLRRAIEAAENERLVPRSKAS